MNKAQDTYYAVSRYANRCTDREKDRNFLQYATYLSCHAYANTIDYLFLQFCCKNGFGDPDGAKKRGAPEGLNGDGAMTLRGSMNGGFGLSLRVIDDKDAVTLATGGFQFCWQVSLVINLPMW